MENSYTVHIDDFTQVDAAAAYRSGEVKATKQGDKGIHMNFKNLGIEFTENFHNTEDRDDCFDVLVGAKPGSVG